MFLASRSPRDPLSCHSPFGEQVLEVDHLHHDVDVLLGSRAEVVVDVALALQLEHHVLDGQALATDAAEPVAQAMRHALQGILDEGFTLRERERERERTYTNQSYVSPPSCI